jgi:hypothetical protein
MNTQEITGRSMIAVLVMLILFGLILITQEARSFSKQSMSASAIPAKERADGWNELTLSGDQEVLIAKDSEYSVEADVLKLRKGTVILNASKRGSVITHSARVDLLGASAYVTADKNQTTVAALKGPVLVKSHRTVILSEGFQMLLSAEGQNGKIQSIPDFWLTEKRSLLKQASQDLSLQTREAVHRALSVGSGTSLSTYTAFRLLLEVQEQNVSDLLLSVMQKDRTMDDLAMSVLQSGVSRAGPLPENLVLWAEKGLSQRIVGQPLETLQEITPLLLRIQTSLNNEGYPRSAKLWKEMGDRLVTLALPLLSREEQALIMPSLESSSVSSTGTTVVDQVPLHPRDAERMARDIIGQSGFLFTVGTTFSPVAEHPGAVRIEGLQYAGAQTHAVSFSLNVSTKEVSSIVLDGTSLPNTLSLDVFLASL